MLIGLGSPPGSHSPRQSTIRMHASVRGTAVRLIAATLVVGSVVSCAWPGQHAPRRVGVSTGSSRVNSRPAVQSTPRSAGHDVRLPPEFLSFEAQFDSLWARFDEEYPSFAYKGVNWTAQRALFRDRALRARSQAEFIAVTCEMLEPLRDLHIWFVDPQGQVVPTYRPSNVANFDRARWTRALADANYVERVDGLGEANVAGFGYLFVGSWNAPVDMNSLDQILQRVRETPGLIIDVRTNGGGSDATALAFAQRFTTRRFAASYVQRRTGPRHEDLDAPRARAVGPRGTWQYLRPVVVITGRAGFSATESFVAALRTLPNVTVIGDTTGGASGSPITLPLGNGWSYTVPQWIEYGPDRQPIEWRGVAPHIAIPWEPSLYERARDPLIDAAVGLLAERNGLFRMAPSGEENGHLPPRAPPR